MPSKPGPPSILACLARRSTGRKIAAEMIGAQYGIGACILTAGALFAIDKLIAGGALLSLIGLAIAWLIGRAEKYFLDWRT